MFFFPIHIKKFRTDASSECLVKTIRANTVYQYNKDGYYQDDNLSDLLFRNEKDKGIYIREQKALRTRYGGGTTAIFISEGANGASVLTSISYYGNFTSLFIVALICYAVYNLFSKPDPISSLVFPITVILFFGMLSMSALTKQRELIEKVIEHCEQKE